VAVAAKPAELRGNGAMLRAAGTGEVSGEAATVTWRMAGQLWPVLVCQ